MNDLTIVYYTSNYLEEHNPYFLRNTEHQLLKAAGDLPIIVVSQEGISLNSILWERSKNPATEYCMGNIGRSHLNIYRQILKGAQLAKTKYVALAEDDIFYSYEHFHTYVPRRHKFAYDMSKLSIFTWTDPPLYSFRTKRAVINQLICHRDLLIEALEERFKQAEKLRSMGWEEEEILRRWGDFGRYEEQLGVTVREREEFYSGVPSIVFTHEHAYGYLNHGKRKRLGDIKIVEVPVWGRAEDMLKLFYEPKKFDYKLINNESDQYY